MFFISDLDRTLIYSYNAINILNGTIPEKICCAEVYNNEDYSYHTIKAKTYCKTLIDNNCFIPATTRTIEQYNRINLSSKKLPWVIVYNGAVVLNDGFVDKNWNSEILSRLNDSFDFIDMEAKLLSYSKEPWLIKIKRASSWFFYFIVDRNFLNESTINELDRLADINNCAFFIQGRKLYFIPKCINKKSAADYIMDKFDGSEFVAAGDSKLDQALIEASVEGYIPSHGELYQMYIKNQFQGKKIYVMESQGIFCGEEILKKALKKIGIPLKRVHKKYVKR